MVWGQSRIASLGAMRNNLIGLAGIAHCELGSEIQVHNALTAFRCYHQDILNPMGWDL